MRKLKMLYVGSLENETLKTNNSSIWSLKGKTLQHKDIMRVVFPANLLDNILTIQ